MGTHSADNVGAAYNHSTTTTAMPVTKQLQEGQTAYRETQKKAMSLGLPAIGKRDELEERIAAHKAKAKAEAKIQQLEESEDEE